MLQTSSQAKRYFKKNADIVMPIASITKIMTAMVVLDAELSLKEKITFDKTDKERIYNGYSRIRMESQLSRGEAIHIALMSSENLASAAWQTITPVAIPLLSRL